MLTFTWSSLLDRARKLDKLSVLKMAVQHIKMLRGSLNSYTEGHYKPPFVGDEELQDLLLHQVGLASILLLFSVAQKCIHFQLTFYP